MTLGIGSDTKNLLERGVKALERLADDVERLANSAENIEEMQRNDRI